MNAMGKDWRPEIVRMIQVKSAIFEADTEGIWKYHLPRIAATADQLDAAEAHLGVRLDPSYRSFLSYANGWPSFYQSVDLLGTADLLGGPRLDAANEMLDAIDSVVGEQGWLARSSVIPIAVTTVDLDMFVMPARDGHQLPPVIWLAGGEIDRFPSFDEYFLAMIKYQELELARLTIKPR